MRILSILYLSIFSVATLSACGKENSLAGIDLIFDSIPVSKPVTPIINETSGIADSKINPGHLWAHEDSGNPPRLFLLSHDGSVVKTVYIKNVINRDWEDMVLSGDNIFIGDIGDNALVHPEYIIYKFSEPPSATDTVDAIEAIRFNYADGPHDAEAFLVDPASKDIYIITKRDNPSRIYKISFPYSTTQLNTATLVSSLTYGGVTSAALSADGKEIIIKTYIAVSLYKRVNQQSIGQALQSNHTLIPYKIEPQGEAVGFANDNSGFFTLSEKGFSSSVQLHFYRRR